MDTGVGAGGITTLENRKCLKVSSDIHIIHIFFYLFVMNNSGENILKYQNSKTRPLGYKTVFMINSIEHKYSTKRTTHFACFQTIRCCIHHLNHSFKNANNSWHSTFMSTMSSLFN